jgi:phenylacetate-CoA ligase
MSWLHTRFVLPFAEPERYSGLTGRLSTLRAFDLLSPDAQREEQHKRLMTLMQRAYRSTPYYRHAFEEIGLRPEDWKPGLPLPLPLLSKATLRDHGEELLSRDYPIDTLQAAQTGGTTGPPVRIWRDVESLRDKVAMQIHLEKRIGYAPGNSVLMIWGADRDLELNPSWKWKIYQQTLMRQQAAPVGNMSEAVFARFYQKLQQYKPKVIYGYSGCVARFAEYVEQQKGGYRSPATVIVTAEPLTDIDRAITERVFGTRVHEFYGSRDIGMVASQCTHRGSLHFHPAASYTEFVPEGITPEGPIYRLVITDLLNAASPLLRYDTADCVLLEDGPCPCGSWHPVVRKIVGRALDNFTLSDGTKVPGVSLTVQVGKLKDTLKLVTGIQFVQKEFDLIQLRFSARGDERSIARELKLLCECSAKLFPPSMRWVHTRVPAIEREASGKLRFTISEVQAI